MNVPAVTVLLAVRDGGKLLPASIESILAQTWRDFELLVIDDGSTDGTAATLRAIQDPRLRVLTNPENLGLTRSLNRGLAEARGEFVARQDADDLSAPDRLEKQVSFLREHPDVQLLGSSAWRMAPNGRLSGPNDLPTTHVALRWASVVDNPFLHTSVMFRRATVCGEFGGYDEKFTVCQDFDLWSRLAARHSVANLRDRLVSMREHSASMTRTDPHGTTAEMRAILQANRLSVFPGRAFGENEGLLLESFRLRFPARELPAMRSLLDKLFSEFLAAYPAARGSADLRATRCRQALRLGYKFLATDRRVALGEIARAFCLAPREWVRQALAAILSRP